MNAHQITLGFLLAALALSSCGADHRQSTASKDECVTTRTFVGGQLSVASDITSIHNEMFLCTPARPLTKGDVLAAMLSPDQAWSMYAESLRVGKQSIAYPAMAMAKSKDGTFHTLVPAWMEFKIDLRPGKIIHANGFQIETMRSVRAGSRIPVLLVGVSSMLSLESQKETSASNKVPVPWLKVYEEGLDASKRAAAMEVWQIAWAHVRE